MCAFGYIFSLFSIDLMSLLSLFSIVQTARILTMARNLTVLAREITGRVPTNFYKSGGQLCLT